MGSFAEVVRGSTEEVKSAKLKVRPAVSLRPEAGQPRLV